MTNRVMRILCTGLVLSAAGCAEDMLPETREMQGERDDEDPASVDEAGELPGDDAQQPPDVPGADDDDAACVAGAHGSTCEVRVGGGMTGHEVDRLWSR